MRFANESMKILKNKMNAEGFNFGANLGKAGGAGIEDHLHYHIVPRWTGDTNFMPVVGTTKVMVEGLNETWVSLKSEFDAIKDIKHACCLLYTSPSPRDRQKSRMPSSA